MERVKKTESDEFEFPLKRELPSEDDDDGMSDAGSVSQSTDENDSYDPRRGPKVLSTGCEKLAFTVPQKWFKYGIYDKTLSKP